MADPATLNRAARIVALATAREPLDAVLRRELTPRRDLSPDKRRAIAGAATAYFRWLGWLDAGASLQERIGAALELQTRFDAEPATIKEQALAACAVPPWIWEEIAFPGASAPERRPWLHQLQRDPALWIRARRAFVNALPKSLGECEPASLPPVGAGARSSVADRKPSPDLQRQAPPDWLSPLVPRLSTGFRYTGSRDLFLTTEFQEGQFEIQDLASQLVGNACAPEPGTTWWDACAGEGGKLLHLADLMDGKGLIWASDRSARRLRVLKERTARARVFNYRSVFWDGGPNPPTRTRFDGVLVDAPCSGVGTWQRHPQARWTASPTDVRELAARQLALLGNAAPSLKPGGRLVYAVCTLTRSETTAIADAFTASHPDFEPAPVFAGVPPSSVPQSSVPASSVPPSSLTLWPQDLNANGMFIAVWRRKL